MNFTYQRIKVLVEKLKSYINKKSLQLDGFTYLECDYLDVNKPVKSDMLPYNGQSWGDERDSHVFFSNNVTVPFDFDENNCIISINTCEGGWFSGNPQFLVYIDGKITNALDYKHCDFPIGGRKNFSLGLYGYIGKFITGGNPSQCIVNGKTNLTATLIEKDIKTEKLYYDIFVPFSALECIDDNSKEYNDILNTLVKVFDIIDLRNPYSKEYYISIDNAAILIDDFYNNQTQQNKPLVSMIGQTHIDVAWLWTKRQVREKALRSFAIALSLLDRYPEYKFMMCQPAIYQYVKEDCPEMFEKIKQKVREGRWEVEGGVFVEPDFNMPTGESIVRQILFAKKFFKEEFNKEVKVAWIPDSFGFSSSIPQIFKKAGIETFITSKLSWNETNTFPYDTFYWKGIDGSKIFSYLLTTQDKVNGKAPERFTIYNASLTLPQVFGTYERFQQKDINDNVLLSYGFGDGGGGPTQEYLEVMQRLNRGINGVPATESVFLGEFTHRIYSKLKDNQNLPEWNGELYFERHRGAYSSVAKIKKNNRRAEFALKNVEQLSILAKIIYGFEYPEMKINECWKTVLINQFHDILSGCSIKEVYDETDVEYQNVFNTLNTISENIYTKIASKVNNDKYIIFSNIDHCENAIAEFEGRYYFIPQVPSNGFSILSSLDDNCSVTVTNNSIENNYYVIVFNSAYEIFELFDKRCDRNIIKPHCYANRLVVYEDINEVYDAWEVPPYYKDKSWIVDEVISVEKYNNGALAGLKIVKKYYNSTITQIIAVSDSSEYISFDTEINWQESGYILKAEFPFDINFNKTVAETQFGLTERLANTNTSWDKARFEFCAQKFIDVSEGEYGVSIINDCKYGHDAVDGVLRLTCLKSPNFPCENIDKGLHSFKYALLPHCSPLNEKTINISYLLNNPLVIKKGTGNNIESVEPYSLISVDNPNLIISAIKKADNSKNIIVRLYESMNTYAKSLIRFGFNVKSVHICDLLENAEKKINCEDNAVFITVKPFEIVTLRLEI